jgi:hypothetical protein
MDGAGLVSASPTHKKAKNTGRHHQLKALGNAMVPQVIYEILRYIDAIENN